MGDSALSLLVLLSCCLALSFGYSTSGNKILDPSGNPIVLRGIARPSLEWNPAGQYLSQSDYLLIKGWGANIVRLSLNQCYWNSNTQSYQNTVDQQVTWIKALGLGVILDLHWSQASGSSCGQQTMPDAQSTTFWTSVATKYKNDAWIIFELYNEPHDVSWSVWKNGGDAGGFTTPGFQALYNTVRATGANNVVLIGGLNYAYDLSQVASNLISGTNIVYNTHPYDQSGKQPSNWAGNFGALLSNYPLIATEFGNFASCDTSYYASWISYADANCISWTAWGWWVQGCDFPSLITDWNGTPSASGALVKAELAKNFKCGSSSATTATTATTKPPTTTTTSTTKSATTSGTTSTTKASTSTTTGGASVKQWVYDDALENGWQDWSWGSWSLSNTNPVHGGTKSIALNLQNYDAIYLHSGSTFQLSSFSTFNFWVNKGSLGSESVQVSVKDASGNDTGSKVSITVTASGWVLQTVSVSQFGVSTTTALLGVVIQDTSGASSGTVYFDDIFWG